MATSGRINGTAYTSYNHRLFLDWTQTKNISGNYSTFAFKLYCYKGTDWSSSYKKDGTLTIGGTSYSFSLNPSGQGNQLLYSGSKTVYHDSNGSASVSVSATWNVEMNLSGTTYNTFKLAGKAVLENIPRGTKISSFSCSSIDWRSLTFNFETADNIDNAYYIKNGGGKIDTGLTNVKTGSFTISGLEANTEYKIQLQVVKDTVTTSSNTITVSTLSGCTGISITESSIDSITVNITNNNSANVKLFVDVTAPEKYNGSVLTYIGVLGKEIGTVNGSYTWTFTDSEKELILNKLKYTATGTGELRAYSYVPGDTIETENYISSHTASSLDFQLDETYKPAAQNISQERDSITKSIFSNVMYLIQGISQLTLTEGLDKITISKGAELYKVGWRYETPSGNTTTYNTFYNDSMTEFKHTFTSSFFSKTGVYYITLIVTDTRKLTYTIKYGYTVFSYHKPIIYAKPVRELNSNGIVSLTYQASISRLFASDADNNSIVSITYGYGDLKDGNPTADTDLSGYTITDSANEVDKELSLDNDVWIESGILNQDTNYRFVFSLQDKVTTTTYYVDMADGVPIMRMLNNGQISINTIPDTDDTNTKFFIGGNLKVSDSIYEGDILLEDKYRRYDISTADVSGTGYLCIAQIAVNDIYADQSIEIKFSQRLKPTPSTIYLRYLNADNNDPELSVFQVSGDASAYICKVSTSTWNIYVYKSKSSDVINIIDYTIPSYMKNRIILSWKNELSDTVPSGSILASKTDVAAKKITATDDVSVNGSLTVAGTDVGNMLSTHDTYFQQINEKFRCGLSDSVLIAKGATGTISVVFDGISDVSTDIIASDAAPYTVIATSYTSSGISSEVAVSNVTHDGFTAVLTNWGNQAYFRVYWLAIWK